MRTIPAAAACLWVLSALSGTASLVYQVVWARMLAHRVGGTSLAVSAVLAAFMGGLAAGSLVFGRRVDRFPSPLRAYVALELGIALLGGASLLLVPGIDPLYLVAARVLPAPFQPLAHLAFAVLVVGPGAFLMGGTLPVLGRILMATSTRIASDTGALYGLNTLGAVGGALLAGFVLIERLGLSRSTLVAAAVNVAVAAAAAALGRALSRAPRPDAPARGAACRERVAGMHPRLAAAVLAGSGFTALGLEVYWTRALQPFLGNSTYAFASMLATMLAGLALGGFAGGVWAERSRTPVRLLGRLQLAAGVTSLVSAILLWEVLPRLSGSSLLAHTATDWREYVARRFLLAAGVMIGPAFCFGATFPSAARLAVADASRVGSGVARLLAANTWGAISGAVLGGFVLLPALGARDAILVASLGSAGLGVAASWCSRIPADRRLARACLAALVLVAVPLRVRPSAVPAVSQEPSDAVLFSREDHEAETRVFRKAGGELHMCVNGQHIGGTGREMMRKELILAHLPMALVPDPQDVLTVGLGSGITLGAFAGYPEIRRLTCVEIVPGVVRGARLFADDNGDALADPRVVVRVDDGAQFLRRSTGRWDVICSDSKLNPAYAGNAPLLADDYYRLCREHLTGDGVMVQWVPLHVPPDELKLILRSFADSFPHVALFWHPPANVLMAGGVRPVAFEPARLARLQEIPRVRSECRLLQVENPSVLANLWLVSDDALRRAVGTGPSTSWDRPILEFRIVRGLLTVPAPHAEDGNLAWFLNMFDRSPVPVRGAADAASLTRFRRSAWWMLRGFEAGIGAHDLRHSVVLLREGERENPDDRRFALLLRGAGMR